MQTYRKQRLNKKHNTKQFKGLPLINVTVPVLFFSVLKSFLMCYSLLRKVLNFVFLRTLLYDGTACEQKTENAKSTVSSITYGAFTIPPSTLRVATVSPAGSVGASALKCRGLHRRPVPLINKRRLMQSL